MENVPDALPSLKATSISTGPCFRVRFVTTSVPLSITVVSTAWPMGRIELSVTTQVPASSLMLRVIEMGMVWPPAAMVPL